MNVWPVIRILVGTIVLTAIVIICVALFKTVRIAQIANALQEDQRKSQALLAQPFREVDPVEAAAQFRDNTQHVTDLYDQTKSLAIIAPLVEKAPRFGHLGRDIPEVLEVLDASAKIGKELEPSFESLLRILQNIEGDPDTIPQLMNLTYEIEPQLEAIQPEIERLIENFEQIENRDRLPSRIDRNLDLIESYLPKVNALLDLAEFVPDLLGRDSDKSYVVVLQNEDGLRPTGGVITGAGFIGVSDGVLRYLKYNETRLSDGFEQENRTVENYVPLRYANLWPDFGDSAESIISSYTEIFPNPPNVDGVIAIDQQLIIDLLAVTGPIEADGMGVIDETNISLLLQQASDGIDDREQLSDWWHDERAFLDHLLEAFIKKIASNPKELDVPAFAQLLLDATNARDIQIWLNHPEAQALIEDLNWAGTYFFAPNHDGLLVVDTNIGNNLANVAVKRTIEYDVELHDDGSADANLRVAYANLAPRSDEQCAPIVTDSETIFSRPVLVNQCYFNYLRVYSPTGSRTSVERPTINLNTLDSAEITQISTATTKDNLTGTEIFSDYMVVAQNKTATASFFYNIPVVTYDQLSDGTTHYSLRLFQQAGAKPDAVTVRVTLPDGVTFIEAVPEPASVVDNVVTFMLEQTGDTYFDVTYR